MNVTIDLNRVIDIEDDRPDAPHVKSLICADAEGTIKLRVSAIHASERRPDGTYARTFDEFERKLDRAGLGQLEILKPILVWGVGFYGQSVYGDGSDGPLTTLERQIHEVLFPGIAYEFSDFCASRGIDPEFDEASSLRRKWRNARADSGALWCHIRYRGDVFVTSDGNFHHPSKKQELLKLGAGDILRPEAAAADVAD